MVIVRHGRAVQVLLLLGFVAFMYDRRRKAAQNHFVACIYLQVEPFSTESLKIIVVFLRVKKWL